MQIVKAQSYSSSTSVHGPMGYEVLPGMLAELLCMGASVGSYKSLFFQLLCPCKSSQGFAKWESSRPIAANKLNLIDHLR